MRGDDDNIHPFLLPPRIFLVPMHASRGAILPLIVRICPCDRGGKQGDLERRRRRRAFSQLPWTARVTCLAQTRDTAPGLRLQFGLLGFSFTRVFVSPSIVPLALLAGSRAPTTPNGQMSRKGKHGWTNLSTRPR